MAATASPTLETSYYQLANYNKVLASTFVAIDIVAVGMRIAARKKQKARLQLDDYLIIAALVLTVGSAATMLQSIAGRNMGFATDGSSDNFRADIDAATKHYQLTSKAEFAMHLLVIPALCLIKLSFLVFYKRLFSPQKISKIRYIISALMVFIILWGLAYTLIHLFICGTNFSAFWESYTSLRTKCVETLKMEYSFGVTDFISDFTIFVLPMPMVWRLQLKPSHKIAVFLVFLLGSGAVAASAVRLAFTVKTVNGGFGAQDGDLIITGMMSWLQLEAFLGILAACLPTIRFLFRGLSPESVVNSIRSALSLHSLHSGHSRMADDGVRGAGSPQVLKAGSSEVNEIA